MAKESSRIDVKNVITVYTALERNNCILVVTINCAHFIWLSNYSYIQIVNEVFIIQMLNKILKNILIIK